MCYKDRTLRGVEASSPNNHGSFNSPLQHEVDNSNRIVNGEAFVPNYQVPRAYTGRTLDYVWKPDPMLYPNQHSYNQ